MPWKPGESGNPKGRPPATNSLAYLIRAHRESDKRRLVQTAYRLAIEGDWHWAEWLAKHGGESAFLMRGPQTNTAVVVNLLRQVPELGVAETPTLIEGEIVTREEVTDVLSDDSA